MFEIAFDESLDSSYFLDIFWFNLKGSDFLLWSLIGEFRDVNDLVL